MQPAKAAQAFADQWRGRGYEKGETQTYWLALLRDVLGVARPEEIIKFEDQVRLGHTGFIDAYIEPTHVLIEQKSIDKDLRKPVRQSDGAMPCSRPTSRPRDTRPSCLTSCVRAG